MKWEYSAIDLRQAKVSDIPTYDITVQTGLNSWELVSVDNGIAYFKRPIGLKPLGETQQRYTFDNVQGGYIIYNYDTLVKLSGLQVIQILNK
jgi:hypothetical protein